MPIPKELEGILVQTPDTLSGAVRFGHTRVPVQALLDTILCGETVDYFLRGFPNVPRAAAEAVIKFNGEGNKHANSKGT